MLRLFIALVTLAVTLRAEIYTFGDSLSDTGNAFVISGRIFPPSPYFNGRFSDGPVWIEHLADHLGRPADAEPASDGGLNYATGGSQTSNLQQQYGLFLIQLGFFNTLAADDLCVIWIGGNDILNGNNGDPPAMVARIETLVDDLIALGARRFLVNNLPDLSKIPDELGTPNVAVTRAQSIDYNTRLAAMLATKRSSSVTIHELDVFAFFESVLQSPAAFAYGNVTDVAYDEDTEAVVDDPGLYVFWDKRHPSATTHRLIGQAAIQAIGEGEAFQRIAVINDGSILHATYLTNRRERPIREQRLIDGQWQFAELLPASSNPTISLRTPIRSDLGVFRLSDEPLALP